MNRVESSLAQDIAFNPSEMQDVRNALLMGMQEILNEYTNWLTLREVGVGFYSLPESVIDWVLQGQEGHES